MKKTTLAILLSTILLLSFTASMVLSVLGNSTVDNGVGPAPNSGDGIPDGSGFDQPNRQNDNSSGKGPAPNSGDGIPDGNGFT
jgi:hypothetical protein